MTYTITLSPETEAVIARRAARKGMTIADYVTHMADLAARKRAKTTSRKHGSSHLTDREFEELLTSTFLTNATPIPADVDVRELAYDSVGV